MNPSFNLNDTIVSIRELTFSHYGPRREAYILKLAGDTGETFVRLYNPFSNEKVLPYIGISFTSQADHNILWFKSSFRDFKLGKGDTVILFFVDGSSMEMSFNTGKTNYSSLDNRNFILLPDVRLMHLADIEVDKVRLHNKTGEFVDCTFYPSYINRQYLTPETGRRLLYDVANKMAYAKQVLRNQIMQ